MSIASWFVSLTGAGKVVLLGIIAAFLTPGFIVGSAIVLSAASSTASSQPPAGNSFANAPEPAPSESPVPKVTTDKVTETVDEPFAQAVVEDAAIAAGTTSITTVGVPGTRERVYLVTFIDGVETSRELVSDEVVIVPQNEVTTVGTYVAPPPPVTRAPVASSGGGCDPNYGGCVPIDSDVDCAGGSGNGPSYLSGSVAVVGSDVYDLDRDDNGIACD